MNIMDSLWVFFLEGSNSLFFFNLFSSFVEIVLGIDNCASSAYRTPKESVSSFHWIPEKLRFSCFLVSKILKKRGQFLAFDFQGRKMSYYNNQQPPVGVPPPQGYPPKDAYPPPGYPPQGYPPPQQGYPPQGYPPQGYAPQYAQPPPRQDNTTGCLEGCLAALCCCCLLDACF
ncbi:splicing factor-like protein 1 [Ziziphus jujuba]|uniref:Splicing factor-like protein 1 n=2 Tax=Ziziphus jujuba TaxID=326968 RepID=A0A6P4AW13_ZIZJJ|nr:splicing factor-like protein 1 [Ziziphus jujuba]